MHESLTRFWGKARSAPDADASMHPLLAHSLDVAAVAVLLRRRETIGVQAPTLGFLVALHDIGKLSRPFQAKSEMHWPVAALGAFPAAPPPPGPAHDAVGLYLLRRVVTEALKPVLQAPGARGWADFDAVYLWRALAGHHGRPPAELSVRPLPTQLCDGCRNAAKDFVEVMRAVFRAPPLPALETGREVARLAWHLAGITTLADWLGSRQAWLPYVRPEAVLDPERYFWNHALPRAALALAESGLAASTPAPFDGVRGLYPSITLPSPVQRWAESVLLPEGPVLAVIEDLTGSGKTEAAMTLAHRLMAAGRAGGVFIGLPTMATANAMYGRLAESYRALFVDWARPSLVLAHGRADLDPRFAAALAPERIVSSPAAADPADEPAEAHCAAWLAEDRRRALLAQIGVGTLDQALLAALPVRHQPLRLQGLTDKVLIVDEAHAFDPYMRRELVALLRFQAALGGSAILLSATLPRSVRQMLVDAFRDGLGAAQRALASEAYPLATLASAADVAETPCAVREGLSRRVAVTRLPDAGAVLERIVAAAAAGAAVAWVRNTVDDAIAAVVALREHGVEALLFHARFAMADRLAIEMEVLRRFGRKSAGAMRRAVLVATQVIEQSLDLDFDVLCTDLAPADLLIQRAGRLWRHARERRPVPEAELFVVSPEPVAEPAADWIGGPQPGTAAVYRDPALLWRSARAIFGRGGITTPEDMRPFVEAAADEADVPPALAAAAGRAEGKAMGAAGVAEQNVLKVWGGYNREAGAWDIDTRTPTRLEDRPQVTLRLARVRDGAVVPYASDDDPRRAWALSELVIARHRVAACLLPPGLEAAAEAARAQWGRWERESEQVLLAVLTEAAGGYTLMVQAESGTVSTTRYDPRVGLHWANPALAG